MRDISSDKCKDEIETKDDPSSSKPKFSKHLEQLQRRLGKLPLYLPFQSLITISY